MAISEDTRHLHLLPRFGCAAVATYFYALSLSRVGFEHQTFSLRGDSSNRLLQRSDVHNFPLLKQT